MRRTFPRVELFFAQTQPSPLRKMSTSLSCSSHQADNVSPRLVGLIIIRSFALQREEKGMEERITVVKRLFDGL